MKIKDAKKIEEARELLEQAQSLINEAVEIDDDEIGKNADVYRTIGDAIDDIEIYLK